jgi:hypothetical protein
MGDQDSALLPWTRAAIAWALAGPTQAVCAAVQLPRQASERHAAPAGLLSRAWVGSAVRRRGAIAGLWCSVRWRRAVRRRRPIARRRCTIGLRRTVGLRRAIGLLQIEGQKADGE